MVTIQHIVGAFALSGLGLHVLEQLNIWSQAVGVGGGLEPRCHRKVTYKVTDADHQQGHTQAYVARNTANWPRRKYQTFSERTRST